MEIEEEIRKAFPTVSTAAPVTDEFIEANPNLMELDEEFDQFEYVPAYMLWCLHNKDSALVDLYTVNVLAEYGRAKDSSNNYLNFKHRCSSAQVEAVTNFLKWCHEEIPSADATQIERALKRWKVRNS